MLLLKAWAKWENLSLRGFQQPPQATPAAPQFWLEPPTLSHTFHLLKFLSSLCVDPSGDLCEGKGAMTFLLDITAVDTGFCYLIFVLRTEPRARHTSVPPLSYLPSCHLIFDGDLCLALAPTTRQSSP